MTNLTVETDRSEVAAGGSTVTCSVRIQPGMADTEVTRHIALCLDTSGSMSSAKIEQVREGVRWVFGYLADDDQLSIVSFDDEVAVLLPATRWGDVGLDDAEALVDDLQPGGGTDILAGLEAAYETLESLPAGPDVGKRILLLSDGRDETPTETYRAFARRVRREDAIAVPSAGIGDDYDEATIRAVGTASDGEWVHLSRATDIEDFFGRKVESLRTVVAPNPHLELALPRGAVLGDAFLRHPQVRDANYEVTDGTVRIYLPDLLEFELQEVVCTIDTPPCNAGRRFTLADLTLNTRQETTSSTIEVECVPDRAGGGTAVEAADVATKHVETRIRNAAAEGDVQRAATIFQQATGEELEGFEDVQTRVRGEGGSGDRAPIEEVGEEGTRIRGVAPHEDQPSPAAEAGDEETQIRGGGLGDEELSGAVEAGDEETQIRGGGPGDVESSGAVEAGDEETKIRGGSPGEGETSGPVEAGDEETQIRGGGSGEDQPSGAVEAGDEETQIRDSTDAESTSAATVGDAGTQIRRGDVRDVREFVDEETVSAWQTMIEEASSGDREAKYETTKIKGPDER